MSSIPSSRRAELDALSRDLAADLAESGALQLNFICTHNSRRSQLAQVWAHVAAQHAGLAGVAAWSGGTEVTAFNPRAVGALRRAGFVIDLEAAGANPIYEVRTWKGGEALRCWSKVYSDAANPTQGYTALMTCSSADEACPQVAGAARRVALMYEDPKAFDGTSRELDAYDDRCRQIAREMLSLFGEIRRIMPASG